MNAFFEFLKWFIKLSLLLGAAIVAVVAAAILGRKSVTQADEVDEADEEPSEKASVPSLDDDEVEEA